MLEFTWSFTENISLRLSQTIYFSPCTDVIAVSSPAKNKHAELENAPVFKSNELNAARVKAPSELWLRKPWCQCQTISIWIEAIEDQSMYHMS